MAAPTLVSWTSSDFATIDPIKSIFLTTEPGDLILTYAMGVDASPLFISLNNGMNNTDLFSNWGSGDATVFVTWAIDSTGGTNWEFELEGSASDVWGFACLVFRQTDGIGSYDSRQDYSSPQTISLPFLEDNSGCLVLFSDMMGIQQYEIDFATVNGYNPHGTSNERLEHHSLSLNNLVAAYYPDVGSNGTKAVGSSSALTSYTAFAIEIYGSANGSNGTTVAWLGM